MEGLQTSFEKLGVAPDEIQPGEAEAAFTLPRSLFSNELGGLIDELKVVRRIIRALAEAATGSVERIEIGTISTTSPEFFFALNALTVAMIGRAVTWSLDTWKQIEDIRKIRADLRKVGLDEVAGLTEVLDGQITKKINEAVDQKINDIIGVQDGVAGRKEEQRTDLIWALNALLQRIERGMTVKVNAIAPSNNEGVDERTQRAFREISNLPNQLTFPTPTTQPVLDLIYVGGEPERTEPSARRGRGRPRK